MKLTDLDCKEWQLRMKRFDDEKDLHQAQFNDLICLASFPTIEKINMSWGDLGRLEFFIMKNNLMNLDFSKMIVKYAPD